MAEDAAKSCHHGTPCNSMVELMISCRDLVNMDVFSKSDPFVVAYLLTRRNTSLEWKEIGRTETLMDNLNPDFKKSFLLDFTPDEKQLLKFEVYDLDEGLLNTLLSGDASRHDFIGQYVTTLRYIVEESKGGPPLQHLLQQKDSVRGLGTKYLGTIMVHVLEVSMKRWGVG